MIYLYRRGDGNDGNYPQRVVTLSDTDCPYAALRALVANDYISGRKVRRHIVKTIVVDGEADYGIDAVCHEGPDGEQAHGAAWLTAALEPLSQEDADYEIDNNRMPASPLREVLDAPAWRQYRADLKRRS